jgi:hypothetical protein
VQGGGCGGGCDLGGGALGDEHAGEEEGEAQVGVLSRAVAVAAVGGGVGDGRFVWRCQLYKSSI